MDDYLQTEDDIIDLYGNKNIRLISDTPGMGKTTVLSSLSRKIKAVKPSQWVIRVDLNDHSQVLEGEMGYRSFDEANQGGAIDFLVDRLMGLQGGCFESRLVKWRLAQTGGVVVLFDGFDEISPSYAEVVTQLI